ncbi:hypothetical protein AB0F85_25005 [Nocardia fluminea]|uniref:hypothetical protein n=1 Tax=Nocardia fluminea TaxID=134984 RepID=UPI003401C366
MSTAVTTLTSPERRPLTLIGDAKLSPYPKSTVAYLALATPMPFGGHGDYHLTVVSSWGDNVRFDYPVIEFSGGAGAISDIPEPDSGRRITRGVREFDVEYSAP